MQGKTIYGYTLQKRLGVGGMAEVWLAENEIGKLAAVKLLLPKFCHDEDIVTRFKNEAKVMVKLDHPNIRQVYDYGEIDGRPSIVMEYLEGDDLKSMLKKGQHFSEEQLEKWWNQMVSALNYTHEKGIVHRDIKPGNIFVDIEDNIQLLDFGIAKIIESISMTQTGATMGTLIYMSPEQVDDPKSVDYRTDYYSLAVTFVNLLTGRSPYSSDKDFEIRESIVYKPLDMTGVPEVWQDFLRPYLEKDRDKRPPLGPFEIKEKPVDKDENTLVTETGDTKQLQTPPIVQKEESKQIIADSVNTKNAIGHGHRTIFEDKPKPVPPKPDTTNTDGEKPNRKIGLWIGLAAMVAIAIIAILMTRENANSCFVKGQEYLSQGDSLNAYIWLTKAAQKNHVEGMYLLGRMHEDYGPYHDLEKARSWYQKASDHGYLTATMALDKIASERPFTVNGITFKMKFIEGGEFQMGAKQPEPHKIYDLPDSLCDEEAEDNEQPVHSVMLSNYYMGETEVTQALWDAVMGNNPSSFKGPNLPVEQVDWNDCQAFIQRLNELTHKNFRLPTEAEWEYAARGGTRTSLYNGENIIVKYVNNSPNLDKLAWYAGNCGREYTVDAGCDVSKGASISNWSGMQYQDALGGTHPVALKQPNAYGLYDMLGNVSEWCSDWYDPAYYRVSTSYNPQGPSSHCSKHVVRGGAWNNYAKNCRVSRRSSCAPKDKDDALGFRLVLSE